jgi:hypothetical protein
MDLTMNPSVSPRSTSASSVARRITPDRRLSTARAAIPVKKNSLARERFLGTRLIKARRRLKIAAAKGRRRKNVTGSSIGKVQPLLLMPQPP